MAMLSTAPRSPRVGGPFLEPEIFDVSMRTVIIHALLGCSMLSGCASNPASKAPAPGRGLHWTWSEQQLAELGYPGYRDEYSSAQWGVLYDDEGVAYGPKSFFEGRTRLEHPYLTVNDEFVQSRWVRIYRSECCSEPLLGHFLEIMDLAWKDVGERIGYTPEVMLSVYTPAEVEDYKRVAGVDVWVTHLVSGPNILMQPVDVLFRRTLAGHAAYAAVAQSLLDLQTHGRIPMWLREGISSYLAQEGFEHLSFVAEFRAVDHPVLMTPAQVEANVYPLLDRRDGRIARYNAFLMVWHLSETYGWDRVRALLQQVGAGATFEDAVRSVYGMELAPWLALLDPTVNGEPTTSVPPRTTK